jgi:starch phosphorylase
MQHGKVSQQMFPDTPIHYITNGVHAGTWVSPAMADLFDRKLDGWRADNYALRGIYGVEPQEIAAAHALNKQRLVETVKERTGVILREDALTLGFARRAATYKRATLLFEDTQRLLHIAEAIGGLQIVYAGKAHPADAPGKALIHEVISAAHGLKRSPIHVVYLENYDMNLAEHTAASLRGQRHQRHEGHAQRRTQPQHPGRMVDRGLRRGLDRMGYRRRRKR